MKGIRSKAHQERKNRSTEKSHNHQAGYFVLPLRHRQQSLEKRIEKTFELPYPTKAMLTYSRTLLSNKRKPAIEATISTTLTTKNFFAAQ